MKRIRVIPILGIQNGNLVKTVLFKGANYLGDPINAIRIYNEKEVDEIGVVDIRSSIENKEPNYRLIEEMAGECFMPLSYGGGITTLDIAKKVFDLGVEKLIFNSATMEDFKLIKEVSGLYGDQSTVVSVDVKKTWLGKQKVAFYSGSKNIQKDVVVFAKELAESGAGELIIHSVDNDGTFSGYDLDIISTISTSVSLPTIALGGARNIKDFLNAVEIGKASAVAASSMFSYKNQDFKSILINYPSQNELIDQFYSKLSEV